MNTSLIALALLFEALVLGACGGALPETRFYQLVAEPSTQKPVGEVHLVLEPFATDPAYDDERIVYRTTPYRLDYYQYHRWSSPPGAMVSNYLEQALENSGKFKSVIREVSADAPAVLGGRVVAIEEVDTSKSNWRGRIVIELTLTDARSGTTLWTEQYEESEALPSQSPEGLAKALSTAMNRIVAKAAPEIAAVADTQQKLRASN